MKKKAVLNHVNAIVAYILKCEKELSMNDVDIILNNARAFFMEQAIVRDGLIILDDKSDKLARVSEKQ